ncbi:MAG: hypothetical protein ABR528_13185 [Pseudonocardiaceae bacterium]
MAAHALGEGLAVGALLGTRPRRMAWWLVAMCLGPALGAGLTDAVWRLETATPLLLAVAVGILAQASRVSLRAAVRQRPGRWLPPRPAAAAALAAVVAALAVHITG